jgi:hypothetical protein
VHRAKCNSFDESTVFGFEYEKTAATLSINNQQFAEEPQQDKEEKLASLERPLSSVEKYRG